MPVDVDIVLPCYNPAGQWITAILSFYNESKALYRLRFIVVNDGSEKPGIDKEIEQLKHSSVPLNFISYPLNRGKGYALRQGVKLSDAACTVYTDIDLPFTTGSMHQVINTIMSGSCDVVAGFRSEEYYTKNMSGFRVFLSRAFRGFIRRFLQIRVSDTQCGLKAFNSVGREKFLQTRINRYLFDFEFIYACCHDSKLRIGQVEVQLKDNVQFSKMKLKILFQELVNLVRVLVFKKF